MRTPGRFRTLAAHPLAPYAVATLAPVPFLLLGAGFGAGWLWPAFAWLTLVKLAADRLLTDAGHRPGGRARWFAPTEPAEAAPAAEPAAAPAEPPAPAARRQAPPPAPAEAAAEDEITRGVAAMLRAEADTPEPGPEPGPAAAADPARFPPLAEAAPPGPAARPPRAAPRLADGDRLSVALALVHFLLLAAAVRALSGGAALGPGGWLLAFFCFGIWFGQVSNANAHELIHRRDRRLRALGVAVYVTLGFGHHASAHRLVHHRFVATPDDPNSARIGESFYAFAARAWPGAFVAGYEMESAIRARRRAGRLPRPHPYAIYLGGLAAVAVLVLWGFGPAGLLAWVALCLHAQMQLLMSDYVQHYGLWRRPLGHGRYEPVAARHSWDGPQVFSALMTLNAPRHADHHLHPGRPWPDLRDESLAAAPRLPYSLAVMGAIALAPRLWRRMMDPRVKALHQPG